jgi:hypothetical protein
MFTLVVPIQTRLPDLLHANRDDTAWVVTATLLAAAAEHHPGAAERSLAARGRRLVSPGVTRPSRMPGAPVS